MGFVVNDDTFLLKFADGPMAGARIEVTELDVRSVVKIQSLDRGDDDDGFLTAAWDYFLRTLVDWNLEYVDRSGEAPVTRALPRTADALAHLGLRKFRTIYRAWMVALAGPSQDPDLGKDSPSGVPALADIEMTEPSSPSHPN